MSEASDLRGVVGTYAEADAARAITRRTGKNMMVTEITLFILTLLEVNEFNQNEIVSI